jgi:hypothetical protein
VTIYIEARFIGNKTEGYHYGSAYQLQMDQRRSGKVTITATHGYLCKPIEGMQRQYASLAEFLHEWNILRIVDSAMVA